MNTPSEKLDPNIAAEDPQKLTAEECAHLRSAAPSGGTGTAGATHKSDCDCQSLPDTSGLMPPGKTLPGGNDRAPNPPAA